MSRKSQNLCQLYQKATHNSQPKPIHQVKNQTPQKKAKRPIDFIQNTFNNNEFQSAYPITNKNYLISQTDQGPHISSKSSKSFIKKHKTCTTATQTTIFQSTFSHQVFELNQQLERKNFLLSMNKKMNQNLLNQCMKYISQVDQLQTVLSMYIKGKKQTKQSFIKKITLISQRCHEKSNKIKEENQQQYLSSSSHSDNSDLEQVSTVKRQQILKKASKGVQLPSLDQQEDVDSRENLEQSQFYNRNRIETQMSQNEREHDYQDYSTPYQPVSYQIIRPKDVFGQNDSNYSFKASHKQPAKHLNNMQDQGSQVFFKWNQVPIDRPLIQHNLINPKQDSISLNPHSNNSQNYISSNNSQPIVNHVQVKQSKKKSRKSKVSNIDASSHLIQQQHSSNVWLQDLKQSPNRSQASDTSSVKKKSQISHKSKSKKKMNEKSTTSTPIILEEQQKQNKIIPNLTFSKPITFLQPTKTLKAPPIEKCKEYEVRKNIYTYRSNLRIEFLELCLNEKAVNFSAIIKIGLFDVSRIQMLSLANNQIADQQLKMLVNFKWLSLISLNLWGNQITDLEPIKKLDLFKIFQLSISWNPLNKASAELLADQQFKSLFHLQVSFQTKKNDEYINILMKNNLNNFPSIGTIKIFQSEEISQSTKMKIRHLVEKYCKQKAKTKKMVRIPKINLIWELSRKKYEQRLERYGESERRSLVHIEELTSIEQAEMTKNQTVKNMKRSKKLQISIHSGRIGKKATEKEKVIKKLGKKIYKKEKQQKKEKKEKRQNKEKQEYNEMDIKEKNDMKKKED